MAYRHNVRETSQIYLASTCQSLLHETRQGTPETKRSNGGMHIHRPICCYASDRRFSLPLGVLLQPNLFQTVKFSSSVCFLGHKVMGTSSTVPVMNVP